MISTTISSTIRTICLLAVASNAFLQIHHHTSCGHNRGIQFNDTPQQYYYNGRVCSGSGSRLSVSTSKQSTTNDGIEDEDDETSLKSIDPSTLQNLCKQYSLSSSGTKQDMLQRLRNFATEQAEIDQQRRQRRTQRVESNLEGKARHTIIDQEGFTTQQNVGEEDGSDEMQGYFYYEAAETEQEKKLREENRRKEKKRLHLAKKASQAQQLTAPPPPEDIKPNEKGERVVTVYSTTEKNDLTGMTSQTPMSDMSMDNAQYQQRSIRADQPEESLVGGPFGDTSGSKRKRKDEEQIEKAKEDIREIVRNLLATTGAPAFQDEYEEGDETNSFSSPYGFTGFNPERIPPDLLSKSSAVLRVDNGRALKEVLSEYELQAIGHDGMAADDKSQGGGHYRECEKVGSFLEGFRKAEERRVARETATMLLERLVKEGVKGLDQLLAGMVREGDDLGDMVSTEGELNSALVRYLEEAIREQERRVKRSLSLSDEKNRSDSVKDGLSIEEDLLWNVTRGEDGTTIETIVSNESLCASYFLMFTFSHYSQSEINLKGPQYPNGKANA